MEFSYDLEANPGLALDSHRDRPARTGRRIRPVNQLEILPVQSSQYGMSVMNTEPEPVDLKRVQIAYPVDEDDQCKGPIILGIRPGEP